MATLRSLTILIVASLLANLMDVPDSMGQDRMRREVRIGAILHLTGDLAMQSNAFLEGIRLGTEEFNASENGTYKLSLHIEDGRNTSTSSNTAARKLVNIERVSALIISSYLDAMASASLFESRRTPALALWDSSPEIDAAGEYIFSIGPWTPSAGEASANFLFKNRDCRTAWILKSQDPFSDSAEESFRSVFAKLGGRIVGVSNFNPDETNFRSALLKLKLANPDCAYSPVVYNIIPLYSQLKELKFARPVVSCNIVSDEHLQTAPAAFEGLFQTMVPDPNNSTFVQLRRTYEMRFKKRLSLPWFVATGYDAARMIGAAVNNAGPQSEDIARGLYRIQDFPGANGQISISATGSWPQHEQVYQIQNGKFIRAE